MQTDQKTGKTVTQLVEFDAKQWLRRLGIPVPRGILAHAISPNFKLSFPLALKVSDPAILHKTDVGGVMLNIKNQPDLEAKFKMMKEKFPASEFLVEEMIPPGIEFIVGIITDPTFGKVIMLGAGGIYTEIYRDVAFRKLPISPPDAKDMLREIKLGAVCSGFRGIKADCEGLLGLLVSVSSLVTSGKLGVESMDLNPVVVTEAGAFVADAKISLKETKAEA